MKMPEDAKTDKTVGRSSERPRIYVASPLGFSELTRCYYDSQLLPRLRESGYQPLDPWADDDGTFAVALSPSANGSKRSRRLELAKVDRALGKRNVLLIEQADSILAVLDGPDVDSGTAAEIGFAYARGHRIIGLRTDVRSTGENDGCTVNLQVEYFILASGGKIVRSVDEAIVALSEVS